MDENRTEVGNTSGPSSLLPSSKPGDASGFGSLLSKHNSIPLQLASPSGVSGPRGSCCSSNNIVKRETYMVILVAIKVEQRNRSVHKNEEKGTRETRRRAQNRSSSNSTACK